MKALFIGRFQPFHKGHLLVLQHACKEYGEVIIGIGSSQYSGTVENPFSVEEREEMICRSLHESGITNYRIVGIPDIHDLPRWVDHVLSLVSDFDIVLSNNPLTKELFLAKGYSVKGTPFFQRTVYSGEEIRRRIEQGEPWEHLVPRPVARCIHKADGIRRIKDLIH